MSALNVDALFTDKQVKELHEALQDKFPLQVQLNAIYDAITGNTALLQEVIGYRNYLAQQSFRGEMIMKVTANLDVTHPGNQLCRGEFCEYPDCLNRK